MKKVDNIATQKINVYFVDIIRIIQGENKEDGNMNRVKINQK